MLNLIKLIIPRKIYNKLKKIKILIFIKDFFKKKDENDKRRYWNGNEIFSDDSYYSKILKKKVEIKKITFENETAIFFHVKKKEKIKLLNFKKNEEIKFKYYFESNKNNGNNLNISYKSKQYLNVINSKPKQFYNFKIKKKSEEIIIKNNSDFKLWISCEKPGKKKKNIKKLNNIILIFIDSIGYDILKNNINHLPFTNNFFKNNISYSNVFSNSDWTASCLTSLINSQYPSKHIFTDLKTSQGLNPVSNENLFKFFKDNGYITNFLHRAKAQNPAFGFDKDVDNYFYFPYYFGNENDDQKIIDKSIELLSVNLNYKNFFLLHFNSTHYPFSNDNLFNQINNSNFYNDNPTDFLDKITKQEGSTKINNIYLKSGIKLMNDRLLTSLRYLDMKLNNLYSYINQNNLFDNTNIILTSDNGTQYIDRDNRFLLSEKRSKVPFIFSNKKYKISNIKKNSIFSNLVDFKKIAKNIINNGNCNFKNYVIGESIFNKNYEICFFYKEKRINFSCNINPKNKTIFLKENTLYSENKKFSTNNFDEVPKKIISQIKRHLNNSKFKFIE